MEGALRHFFWLNVKGEGLVLYSGTSVRQFLPRPLGIESSEVPNTILEAHQRISAAVKGNSPRWSLAVRRPGPARVTTLAYGSRLDGSDEFGRPGLRFIHGVELDGPEQIRSAIVGVLSFVAGKKGEALVREVESRAVGVAKRDIHEFLSELASSLEAAAQAVAQENQISNSLISSVLHNCGGAAATAWLALAAQQAGREPPWSFFDLVEKNGHVTTMIHPPTGQATSASELLLRASFGDRLSVSDRRPKLLRLVALVTLLLAIGTTCWQTWRAAFYHAEAEKYHAEAEKYHAETEKYLIEKKSFSAQIKKDRWVKAVERLLRFFTSSCLSSAVDNANIAPMSREKK
jgi:hypothetical protein